jgi:hypothetical protein
LGKNKKSSTSKILALDFNFNSILNHGRVLAIVAPTERPSWCAVRLPEK